MKPGKNIFLPRCMANYSWFSFHVARAEPTELFFHMIKKKKISFKAFAKDPKGKKLCKFSHYSFQYRQNQLRESHCLLWKRNEFLSLSVLLWITIHKSVRNFYFHRLFFESISPRNNLYQNVNNIFIFLSRFFKNVNFFKSKIVQWIQIFLHHHNIRSVCHLVLLTI
jgi:hypothetical protein